MKKITTGTKFALLFAAAMLVFFQRKSFNMISIYNNRPEVHQYLNRLIEFYDLSSINMVKESFFEMLDYGLDPDQIFNILVSKATK